MLAGLNHFPRASKSGRWELSQGELGVDGVCFVGILFLSWGFTFDIFSTTYLIYGRFGYKFFFILTSNMYMFCL